MDNLLLKVILLGALGQLGLSLAEFEGCLSKKCLLKIQRAQFAALRIDWKDISVFPDEAKRFR